MPVNLPSQGTRKKHEYHQHVHFSIACFVAVDTALQLHSVLDLSPITARGMPQETSKLVIIPHANAVLAGRGVLLMLTAVYGMIHSQSHSFDDAFLKFDQILDQSLKALRAQLASAGFQDPTEINAQEIVFVGWSGELKRIIGGRWRKETHEAAFSGSALTNWGISPHCSWTVDTMPAQPNTRESMVDVMQQQVDWATKNHPGLGFGGRPIIVEITENRLDLTIGAPFSNHQRC